GQCVRTSHQDLLRLLILEVRNSEVGQDSGEPELIISNPRVIVDQFLQHRNSTLAVGYCLFGSPGVTGLMDAIVKRLGQFTLVLRLRRKLFAQLLAERFGPLLRGPSLW